MVLILKQLILNDAIEEIMDNVRSVSAELDPENIEDMTRL